MQKIAVLVLLYGCGPTHENQGARQDGSPSQPQLTSSDAPSRQTAEAAVFRFVDVSAESGLDFVNVSGGKAQDHVLESMSAGAAFVDYDGDGFQDLFVVNGTRFTAAPEGARNRLFHNEAITADGNVATRGFREANAEFGAAGWGMGCAAGDYDNDGDVDLYVTYWGPNRLYRNDDGGFAEVAEGSGVADPRWGSSAAFGDLDADGFVDLYVTNYLRFDLQKPPGGGGTCLYRGLHVFCGPAYAPRQADRLYRNEAHGQFSDVSAATGVADRRLPALGVVFGDFDADADLDIYVANDGERNLLFRNEGDWQFEEIAKPAGVAFSKDGMAQAGMGVHAGDYDNDGDLDLFTSNFSDDYNTLYRNDGPGTFADATSEAGLGETSVPFMGWGTGFVDFDSDGWLDLFVANGHLYPQLDRSFLGLFYAQRNLLYHNQRGRFVEVGAWSGPGLNAEKVSRAAAIGDYDNDGDADLFIVNLNDSPTLLRNDSRGHNNWLGLKLTGGASGSNRDAIGARVWVRGGGMEQMREVHRSYSFQAQHDPRLLFGLGAIQQVDQVEIRWPSGRRQILHDPPLCRYLNVRES